LKKNFPEKIFFFGSRIYLINNGFGLFLIIVDITSIRISFCNLFFSMYVMFFFFFFSLSQTQLVGIGQPTRALLLLTLVANGPTRARFSLLAHNLVKFPPAGNTEKERDRKKKETTALTMKCVCARV